MKASVVSTETHRNGYFTIYFRPSQKFQYSAGQFIELIIDHKNPDSRGTRRWFTLSSAPHEPVLAVTTKTGPCLSTFKQALLRLNKDDEVEISQAMGDFVLPRSTTIPVLFIAGGIGITPIHSILKSHAHSTEDRHISLI